MIPLNQEQRLGRRAYLLMASRRMTAGLGILLVAAFFLVLNAGIASLIATPLGLANVSHPAALASTIVTYADIGLWLLGMLACLGGVIIARLEYANYTFTFEEFDLKLKRGIIATKIVSIPYRSMQDIDLERSVMHRMTKTSRVVIDSAGTEDASEHNETDIILDPIGREEAEDIRSMLQRKIGVQIVKSESEADVQAGENTQIAQNSPNAQTTA